MQDYKVAIDAYHGPLDLLLYLIKRDEVDIHDIPVSRVAEQYLKFLETLKELDINLAGEFLVMAATLMEIKSALLMPKEVEQSEELKASEDPSDPRYELIQQLLAYKRFKDAAGQLDTQRAEFESRFVCAPILPDLDEEVQLDIEDLDILKLVDAFQRVMEQTGKGPAQHEVYDDDTPIELHLADLEDRLKRDGAMTLQNVFVGRNRGEMVGLFLATLELVRQRKVMVKQGEPGTDISLVLRPEDEVKAIIAAEADAGAREKADPSNPEDFDWPDEHQKKRYARRQARRAKGEEVEEDALMAAEIAELEAMEAGATFTQKAEETATAQTEKVELEKDAASSDQKKHSE